MATVIAPAEATTDATPFTPHAQATPSGWSSASRPRPSGMAMPSGMPAGASSSTVSATRREKGRSISAASRGNSPKALAPMSTQDSVRAIVSARRESCTRPASSEPSPLHSSSAKRTTDSA